MTDIRDVRNTRSMPLDPEHMDDYSELDEPRAGTGLVLRPVMTGALFKEAVNYPVIVETWEKAKFGRHRRAWLAQFTRAERNKVARYYARFYRWHLVTGTPAKVSCQLSTISLLQKAVAFFGGI